jgi:exopolysaccharide biosynthesis polyprenyl glycosylphosphotransferase
MALVSRRRSHSSRLPAPASSTGQAVTGSSANLDDVVNARPTVAPVAARLPRQHVKRGWLVRRMLLAADVVGLSIAFFATELLFLDSQRAGHRSIATLSAIFVLVLPAWILAAKFYGLYDQDEERATHSTADEVFAVFHLITVGVWLFFATSWLIGLSGPNQAKLTTFWLLALVSVIAMRAAARAVARRQRAYIQNTVIVGAGDIGQLIARKLYQHPEYGINLIGFVDVAPKQMRRDLEGAQVVGEPDEIEAIVNSHEVDRVIVAFSGDRHQETLGLIRALREHDVQIDIVPRLFEAVSPSTPIHRIEGLPLLSVAPVRIPRSSRLVKRALDLVGASILLALTAPLMLVVSLVIRRDSPGPVFFRQRRLGMDMREFTLLKFRTMRDGTDEAPHREYMKQIVSARALPSSNNLYKLERADAVTRVGQWLRRTSIDELPQLINVMRGQMSLVGPRPAIGYELELYAPHHFERFLVPAGLTGLWQVEARSHSTFGEALDLDVAYARGWSLGLDLRLLLRTPVLMLRKRETG